MTPPPSDAPDASTEERARRLVRREPPRFRRVDVRAVRPLSPRLVRVTLGGPELDGFSIGQPAASVRLLLPSPGRDELVMPMWDGNEFLLPGGERPAIRTLTPRRLHEGGLDVDIVLHDGGVASGWAAGAEPGAEVALSGPGRGFAVDPEVRSYLLAGDESAIPAISQLLEVIADDVSIDVRVEVAHPDARLELPGHPGASVTWHDLDPGSRPGDALVAAVESADIRDGAHVWAAGEAAAVQRIRKHLAGDRCLPRSQTTVRGYWKVGRSEA
jgi:NADPH-dependent ferric siderophore reductase